MTKKKNQSSNSYATISPLLNCSSPLVGCWINQDWQTAGTAYIVIARKMKNGLIMFAIFQIDTVQRRIQSTTANVGVTEERFRRIVLQESNIPFFQAELDFVKDIIFQHEAVMLDKGESLPENYLTCIKLIGPRQSIANAQSSGDAKSSELANAQSSGDAKSSGLANAQSSGDAKSSELANAQSSGAIDNSAQTHTPIHADLTYSIKDYEIVETELRQLEFVEEMDDSTAEQRKFSWQEDKTKGLRFAKEKETIAQIILDQTHLYVSLINLAKKEYMNTAILQYLGSLVS